VQLRQMLGRNVVIKVSRVRILARDKQLPEIDLAGLSYLEMLKNSRYAKFLAEWVGQNLGRKP
jgi:hypothetical protein